MAGRIAASVCLRSALVYVSILLFFFNASTCPAQGVRLNRQAEKPGLVNAEGKPFVAKGVVYYQPNAAHHYFLEGLDLSRLPQDLKNFKAIGFNTLSIDVGWGELFAEVDTQNNYLPVRINNDRVEKLKKLAAVAKSEGFYLSISPGLQNVPPQLWAKEFPASTDKGGNFHPSFKGYLIHNWLVDDAVNAGFVHFLEFLGDTLKPFDNVACYALYFELIEQQFPWCHNDPLLVEKWRQYLKDKNASVDYWNKRWNENYNAIDEITLPYRDRENWRPYFEKVLKIKPKESHRLMWQDCYDFMIVAIGSEGRYGLSFKQIAGAIRRGDPDALILWKAHEPAHYAGELGVMDEFNAGKLPPDANNILKKIYAYPGVDLIACDGYPAAEKDPAKRADELTFKRNYDRARAIRDFSPLPLYCQEYGIDHSQWSTYECEKYLVNAIKGYQELDAVGYNLWQSQDYYGGGNWDDIQPNFGLFDVHGKPLRMVEAIAPLLGGHTDEKGSTIWDKYLDDRRLQYHGYFLHDDVLEHKEEITKLADYTNIIFCNAFNLKDTPGLSLAHFFLSDLTEANDAFFENASKRLRFLDSLGFTIICEYPSAYLIADGNQARFTKNLKYIKSRVPEMEQVDYFYIADEPDINPIPSVEMMECAIDIMKEVFPNAKSTACYALPEPRMLDAQIPKNLDLLMVDPYFLTGYTGNTTVDDFELFFRSRLATTLSWANRWNKPFLIIGDSFWSVKSDGKMRPTAETSKWFYQTALLQPNCIGLGWFLYGSLYTNEGLRGLSFNDPNSAELLELHQQIGKKILHDKPSLLGVNWRVDPASIPEDGVKALVAKELEQKAKQPGLYVEDGILMRHGKPYIGIGVNCFDAFYRVIKDPNNKSYKDGLKTLKEKYNIPFVRFMAGGYWPADWTLYLKDKPRYFALMDELVAEAEKQDIGLIPSLFWYVACVPDIVGEPMDQVGNPDSKTIDFIRTYTQEIVTRYRNSPAIWAWEFGNEHMLQADIIPDVNNPDFGRAQIVQKFGTPTQRSDRDRFKRTAIQTSYRIFADEVRKLDPRRMICSGDATPPENSYHRHFLKNWGTDTQQQWTQMLINDNSGGIDSISIHIYPLHDKSYFPEKSSLKELIVLCNDTAKKEGKPLFIGEFGASKELGAKKEKAYFFEFLNIIEQQHIPLSAVWVYDFQNQDKDWNITADNDRAYMLEAIKEANTRISAGQPIKP